MEKRRWILAVVALLLPAGPLWADLNNGFDTEYVYAVRNPDNGGQVRVWQQADGTEAKDLFDDETDWETLTIASRTNSDARMFLAKAVGGSGTDTGTDIQIIEADPASGPWPDFLPLNSKLLSTIPGVGTVGASVSVGTIRYSTLHNTLFISADTDSAGSEPVKVWEIDLALTTLIHTYIGESDLPKATGEDVRAPANITLAPDGMMYMVSRHLGGAADQGDVIAFDTTAGHDTVGGINSSYTVLIDGPTFVTSGHAFWVRPQSVIFRKGNRSRDDGSDTLLVLMGDNSADQPIQELYLNTTLHPKDSDNNLAVQSTTTLLAVRTGWNGEQHAGSGDVIFGADRQVHILRADNTDLCFGGGNGCAGTLRSWFDAARTPFKPCNSPPMDTDGDSDVDQKDFSVLQLCFTGPFPLSGLSRTCSCLDLGDDNNDAIPDRDGDIDGFDVTAFEACASGPGIPANPACGD